MPDTISATVVAGPGERAKMLTAEQVAGIPAIGEACDELEKVGWRASIAGNRITVNDEVFAQFIGATVGALRRHRRQVGDLQDRRHASGIDCWSGA